MQCPIRKLLSMPKQYRKDEMCSVPFPAIMDAAAESPAPPSPASSESSEEEEPLDSPPAGAEAAAVTPLPGDREEQEEDDDLDQASSLVQEIRESIQSGLLQRELQKRLLGEMDFT